MVPLFLSCYVRACRSSYFVYQIREFLKQIAHFNEYPPNFFPNLQALKKKKQGKGAHRNSLKKSQADIQNNMEKNRKGKQHTL